VLKILKKKNIKAVFIVLAIVVSAKLISTQIFIASNQSTSLDGRYFLAVKTKSFNRGDIVVIQLQDNPYYGNAKFTKILKGQPGDIIEKQGFNFFINGEFIATAKEFTEKGTPLISLELMSNKIPNNYYFLSTDHKDSYDSRYDSFGYIPADRIIAKAYRIY